MKPNNPAIYECPKGGTQRLHCWKRNADRTATCVRCKLVLSAPHADEVFTDYER